MRSILIVEKQTATYGLYFSSGEVPMGREHMERLPHMESECSGLGGKCSVV